MIYSAALKQGRLTRRYKRFLADIVDKKGNELTIHCPNTGSMKNCMEPGSTVWYSTSPNPKRKYAHTWEFVSSKTGGVIGINTGLANRLVREAIDNGTIKELQNYSKIRSEVRYGAQNSRIDFLLHENLQDTRACYVEVKNVSLHEGAGLGLFPDAQTERGQKHLQELMAVVEAGYRAVLFFCVQHSEIDSVSPAVNIDARYSQLLSQAVRKGVEVIAYRTRFRLEQNEVSLIKKIPVLIS